MDIQTEKLGLIEWISRLTDSNVIRKLKSVKEEHQEEKDWGEELSKAEKESIARGLKDFEVGRTHDHEEVRKLYEKYLLDRLVG